MFRSTTSSTVVVLGLLLLSSLAVIDANVDVSSVSNSQGITLPQFRYVSWEHLHSDHVKLATTAGYEEKTWNKVATNKLEKLNFETVAVKNAEAHDALKKMGFKDTQWDCYVNHYKAYEWRELEESQLQQHYIALGWTEKSWNDYEDPPKSNGKYWEDLTEPEQAAALELCYFQELWDEIAIPYWNFISQIHTEKKDIVATVSKESGGTETENEVYQQLYSEKDRSESDSIGATDPHASNHGSSSIHGGPKAHNSRKIELPAFRYVLWEELSREQQSQAAKADYDEKSWNSLTQDNKIEKMDYETIGAKSKDTHQALMALGFKNEDQWDCFISHYKSYTWKELAEYKVQKYYVKLGWTEKMWNGYDDPPKSDGKYWPDLKPEEQAAAFELCYFRETWDEVSMQYWPTNRHGNEEKASTNTGVADEAAGTYSNILDEIEIDDPYVIGSVVAASLVMVLAVYCCCGCCCRGRPRRRPNRGHYKNKLSELDLEVMQEDDDHFRGIGMQPYSDNPVDPPDEDDQYEDYEEEKDYAPKII